MGCLSSKPKGSGLDTADSRNAVANPVATEIDRSEIERNANGCEEPSSADPELWNVDNCEVDILVKYKVLYVQHRDASEAGCKAKSGPAPVPGRADPQARSLPCRLAWTASRWLSLSRCQLTVLHRAAPSRNPLAPCALSLTALNRAADGWSDVVRPVAHAREQRQEPADPGLPDERQGRRIWALLLQGRCERKRRFDGYHGR
jgi:hypothetical protein